jgi:hypothetical protein
MHLIGDWWRGIDNPYYLVTWWLLPNLAADLIVPPLGLLIGVEAATKLFLILAKLLIVTGAVALERVVRGRHLLAGLFALLVLYNRPFSWGLVNFEFATGIALWATAAWIALRDRPLRQRAAVHAVFVLLLFLGHFLALGIYGFTIGLLELARWTRRADRPSTRNMLRLLLIMAAPVALLLALTHGTGGAIGGSTTEWAFGAKLLWPLIFLNADQPLAAAAMAAALAAWLALLCWRKRIGLGREGAFVLAGLVTLYLVMPRQLFETDMIDIRLLVPFFLVMPAFVSLHGWRGSDRRAAALFLTALILINLGIVAHGWRPFNVAAAELRAATSRLPRGSRILVARSPAATDADSSAPVIFVPTLAVHDIGAFTPSLYTMAGVQPVSPRPALERLRIQAGVDYRLPPFALLAAEARSPGSSRRSYLASWTRDFDALILIGPSGANPLPAHLLPATAGRAFAIYRLKR